MVLFLYVTAAQHAYPLHSEQALLADNIIYIFITYYVSPEPYQRLNLWLLCLFSCTLRFFFFAGSVASPHACEVDDTVLPIKTIPARFICGFLPIIID